MIDPLVERYATPEMAAIWDPAETLARQRKLWVGVLGSQIDVGATEDPDGKLFASYAQLDIDLVAGRKYRDEGSQTKEQMLLGVRYSEYRRAIAEAEQRTRHDLKAHLEVFDQLAGGHGKLHLGLTSADITEAVSQGQVVSAAWLTGLRMHSALDRLSGLAQTHKELVLTGRTHNVPAQAVTLGIRFARCAEEMMLALERLDTVIRQPTRLPCGAVGTHADTLAVLGQTAGQSVDAFDDDDRMIATGQNYHRSMDWDAASALIQTAMGPASLAVTLRLMAGHALLNEGHATGQVGSSAMPHKVNPRMAERIQGLQHVVRGYAQMIQSTGGNTWNEGDVSDSVVRRVALPGMFLAIDGLLRTFCYLLDHLKIDEGAIAQELFNHSERLASGAVLAGLVRQGVPREQAHTRLRAWYSGEGEYDGEFSKVVTREAQRVRSTPPGLSVLQVQKVCARIEQAQQCLPEVHRRAMLAWEPGVVL